MRALRNSGLITLLVMLPLLIIAKDRGIQNRWGRENGDSWGRSCTSVFQPSNINWSHYFTAECGVKSDSSGKDAESGEVVYFWLDQTANYNNGAQGTNANRPVFISNVNNGANGITFDSNDDYLNVPNNSDLKELTYFWVLSSAETGSVHNAVFGHSTSTSYIGSFKLEYVSEKNIYGNYSTNLRIWEPNLKCHDGSPHVFMLYIAGSAQADISNCTFWVDGVEQTVSATNAAGIPAAWNNLMIGRNKSYYGGFTISEFAVYEGKIPEADRINLQNYWIKKYRIEP
ncbi:LamG domain-containing protein [bacterium]|nr:LamG domain-containing protein [bacterium]